MSWSYSRYGLWKQCPRKYKFRVVDKLDEPGLPPDSPAVRGQTIHKMFENYLLGEIDELTNEFSYYTDFLNDLRAVNAHPEIMLAVDKDWNKVGWDDENMWFRCILDALTLHDDRAVIYDWKTGKEYPDHLSQREVYACAVSALYPDLYEIDCYHVYLDSKSVTHNVFHRDQIPALQSKWEANVQQMFDDAWYPANPSWLCRYCHFRKENLGPCEF